MIADLTNWRGEGFRDRAMSRLRCWVDVIAFVVLAAVLAAYTTWSPRVVAGMTLAGAAFVLWMAARIQLGASFTVTAQARKLVTTGLYSRFRNPVYLFGTLAYAGLVVAWGRLPGYLYLILSIPIELFRIRKEAAVLEETFGDAYRNYKARTWF